MPDPTDRRASALLAALAEAAGERPPVRTVLVAPTRGEGKELLRALARDGTAWLGVEALTLRPLALEVAASRLAADGRTPLDDLGEQALLDAALDEAMDAAGDARLRELAEGVGFRGAVRGAVQALRLAGVPPGRVAAASLRDRVKRDFVAAVQRGYEARLDDRVDTAAVLAEAAAVLEGGGDLPWDRVLLVPGLGRRGLAGRLLDALLDREARVLPADPVVGVEPPAALLWNPADPASPLSWLHAVEAAPAEAPVPTGLDLFRAASVVDELKEVLRRVMAAGLAWDQVEIVATDPGVYGPALHTLAARMDVPVTFGVGLPVERTRAGRAVEAWFRWISDGFPSPVIRRLLESGVLRAPGGASGAALARRLRRLRVGWGRERYQAAFDAALRPREGPVRPGRKESQEEAEARVRRERDEVRALRELILPLVDAVPPVPGRVDTDPPKTSPAHIARALGRFLEAVPRRGEVERTALDRLGRVLRRIEAELDRPSDFHAAVTVVREHLEIRVPAPRAEGPAPWRSTGGHLYMTDLRHGGASGREATFVVGLDARRAGGAAYQDPLLLDRERRAVAGEALPTSGDRLEEARFALAALLARLRGRVTLSYAAWDPAETRGVLPASVLLQALRLERRDPTLGYGDLDDALGDPASAVPRQGSRRADAADVWLHALAGDGGLRRGVEPVRAAFPALARGLALEEAMRDGEPGRAHGLVTPRPDLLDPRRSRIPVSASRLETLGKCPRRYFLRYVLGLYPPDDPNLDPEVWLDPLQRGALLHRVYERVLGEWPEGGELEAEGFAEHALAVLAQEAERALRDIPAPSASVLERERQELEDDVRAFVAMVRREGRHWIALELSFGMPGDARDPVEIDLPGGSVLLRGAIDRVDQRSTGLHLVDYKTGRGGEFPGKQGPFVGGRRLQHLLYSEAAERIYGEPVARLTYQLPTRRAENQAHAYHRGTLAGGLDLVALLLDQTAEGRFLPTEDCEDCRYCDYRAVCRVTVGSGVESPPAAWGAARFEGDDVYDILRRVRSWGT